MRYRLYGVLGSPYVAKLRALLRYRHIPFDYVPADFDWAPGFSKVRPELADVQPRIVPVVLFPANGSMRVDSTVIAQELERLHLERSAVPPDPGLAFLSALIEDMGDEWALKVAFQYRWGNEEDRNYSNRLIMSELLGGGTPQATIDRAAQVFRDRQIGRMPLVGCTPANEQVIATTYHRLMGAFDKLREDQSFLFGGRPSMGDFGLFGALFTCRNDPTPGRLMRERSPATLQWVYQLDEASGVEGAWTDEIHPGVVDLLRLCGEAYLPFLRANLVALEENSDTVELEIWGDSYRQAPFRYQAKCLRWLQHAYSLLQGEMRRRTRDVLGDTHCLAFLES
jgi:glutathione S-transferase